MRNPLPLSSFSAILPPPPPPPPFQFLIDQVLILRNHGLVALGETIEEAFHYLFNLVKACETQVAAIGAGIDPSRLLVPSRDVQQQVWTTVTRGGGGVSSGQWAVGELEFEAYVRMLDSLVGWLRGE